MAKFMIYITGKGGQLASELEDILSDYKAFTREEWDITDLEQTESILSDNPPKVIINCAAYNFVDKAEEEHEIADAINHKGPQILAQVCDKQGIFLIHISSDFVFGPDSQTGRPLTTEDAPDPQSVYAKSKLAGEKAVLAHKNTVVIRTSWVYSSYGANFVKTILKLASDPDRKELAIIADQIGRPTRARSLAVFIQNLIQKYNQSNLAQQLFHFSNEGIASWYDFAFEICRLAGKSILVKPIPTEAYPLPAKRPSYSVMNLSSAFTIQESIPHWKEDLAEELQNMV